MHCHRRAETQTPCIDSQQQYRYAMGKAGEIWRITAKQSKIQYINNKNVVNSTEYVSITQNKN